MSGSPPVSRESLAGLAAFLPVFESPGFTFGTWLSSTSQEPGETVMPTYLLSHEGEQFYEALYKLGWVRSDFDWSQWASSPEAVQLREDPEAILTATPDQLARLLTAIVRSDRFCEGTLAACYDSGLLLRVLRRASALCDHQS